MKQLLTTSAVLALLTTDSVAQDALYLGELVIDTGFGDVDVLETGVAVDVIDAEELESTGETRLVDLLARQPSVTIRSNGPLGNRVGLSIRGVGQNNVSVRIDGIDVSDPSGPQVAFDFGGLLTTDVSRIEILRGSQSAAFGSESVGGVINITTKSAALDGQTIDAAFEYGSFGTSKASVTFYQNDDRLTSAISVSHVKSDGYSVAEDGDEEDGFEAKRISLSGTYALTDTATLSFSAFAEDSEFDYDETFPGVTDGTPDDVTVKEQRGARLALAFETGAVDHELSVSGYRIYRQLTGTNGFGPFEFNYEGTRAEYAYRGGVNVGATGRLSFGVERTIETYEDWSAFGSQTHDTTINGVFGEYRVSPTDALDVSAALRHDDHSEFGGFWTARLSGVYRLRDDLILRANAATGYRAPSPYELYDTFSGNLGLEPETSRSFDLGIEKRFGNNGYLRATAFWVEAEDIIDYSFTTFTYVQRDGTSTRRGLELAGGVDLTDRLTLDASYTLTDSYSDVTLDSSDWSTTVPRHAVALTLGAELSDRARLTVTGLYEADRQGLDDYGVVNTTFAYDVTEKLEGYVRIENLFDADYQTVPGYATPERSFYVGLRASF